MGTLDGIIDTVSADHPLLPLIGLLKSHGKLVMVGVPMKPLELHVVPLLLGKLEAYIYMKNVFVHPKI
jgi:cinnamyl-alcohol dehydrogenase